MLKDKIEKGRFIVVEWKSKDDKNEERLENFIKGKMPNESIKVMKNPEKSIAQVEFTSEQDPEYLKILWSKRQFWEITNIYAKEESCRIKVENIPSTAEIRDIYRYFTNARNVTMRLTDVEVEERFFCPMDGRCVVRLSSPQDVKAICARSKDFIPYRDLHFVISPFYEELNPSNDEISNKYFYVDPITVADVDGTKLMYLKDFHSDKIDEELSVKCGKIKWCDSGIKKVEIIFDCSHEHDKRRHSEIWRRDVKTIFLNILGKVRTIRKTIPGSTWHQVIGVLEQNSGDIWVDEDENKHTLVLVGLNDDIVLKTMELEIDKLAKPKPIVDKKMRVEVRDKLDAFARLELQDSIGGVDINIDVKSGLIKIHGEETQVKEAETCVLQLLNHIVFCETDLAVDGFSGILSSQLIQDKINADKESNGWRCGFLIDGNRLKIFAIDQTVLNGFKDLIMAQLSEQDIRYEGRVDTHSTLRENLQKIEDEYSPYVKLSVNVKQREVVIHIVSTKSHVDCIVEELNENIDAYLIKEEIVPMGPSVFKYFLEKSFPDLKSILAQLNLKIGDVLQINEEKSVITVVGDKKTRNKVIPVVTKLARAIRSHWSYIEREGIHNYMLDGKGNSILGKINAVKKCHIRWVTQYEMMEDGINCIVPLKTGQSIFLCYGSLIYPGYPIDAIVIAANKKLQHKRQLAADLVSKGENF
ncbi:poly ADP-ribose polymerase [Mactra antiquata]